jgi:sterol carrier protein 2
VTLFWNRTHAFNLAACCIVASEAFVKSHKLENQAIEIVAQALTTDQPMTFDNRSAMELIGYSMTKDAADRTFAQAGFKPGEGRDLVGVVELHDCFAANEVRREFLPSVRNYLTQ